MLHAIFIVINSAIAVTFASELYVVNTPDGISFHKKDSVGSPLKRIKGNEVAAVVQAALGCQVSGHSKWDGIDILNPFSIRKSAAIIVVKGTSHLDDISPDQVYSLDTANIDHVLNDVNDFNDFSSCGVNVRQVIDHTWVNATLESHARSEDLINLDIIRVPYMETISSDIRQLADAARSSGSLLIAIASQSRNIRQKRDAVQSAELKNFNLASHYDENYPIIFNIILWFMVAFLFALLAVCYVIAIMDPGRDSIIYRMTSTRMKKDN